MASNSKNNTPRRPTVAQQRQQETDTRFDRLTDQLNQLMSAVSGIAGINSAITGINGTIAGIKGSIHDINARLNDEHKQVNEQFIQMKEQMHIVHAQSVNADLPTLDSADPVSSDHSMSHRSMVPPSIGSELKLHNNGNSSVHSTMNTHVNRMNPRVEIKLFGRPVSTVLTPAPKLAGPTIEVDKFIKWSKEIKNHATLLGVNEYISWPAHRILTELHKTLGDVARTDEVKHLVASRCKQVSVMIWNAVGDVIPDLGTVVSNYYMLHPCPPDPVDSMNGMSSHVVKHEADVTRQPPPPINEVGVSVSDDPYLTMCYLDAQYNNDNVININGILTKYLNFRWQDGWSSTKFMSEFVSLKQRLRIFAQKHPIPLGEFVPPIVDCLILLNGLPRGMIIEQRLLLNEKELSVDKIHQQIINWEELNKRRQKEIIVNDDTHEHDTALYTGISTFDDDKVLGVMHRKSRGKAYQNSIPRNYERLYDKHSNKTHAVNGQEASCQTDTGDAGTVGDHDQPMIRW